jgi:predicted nucleotidyltransferase
MLRYMGALERAARVLAADAAVRAVYGFGSRAHGDARPDSDVDVAVLLAHVPTLREQMQLRADVVRALRRDDVDLVVLNLAPPLLRYEVVTAGRRLFARDELAADMFEQRCVMQYLDTAYLRAQQQRLLREAVE